MRHLALTTDPFASALADAASSAPQAEGWPPAQPLWRLKRFGGTTRTPGGPPPISLALLECLEPRLDLRSGLLRFRTPSLELTPEQLSWRKEIADNVALDWLGGRFAQHPTPHHPHHPRPHLSHPSRLPPLPPAACREETGHSTV